jgi:hydrogenase maturation protein HypF
MAPRSAPPLASTAGAAGAAGAVRRRIRVRGIVQGVGFRPFVYRLATGLGLGGHVGNDADGVLVEVEGDPAAVADFEARLRAEAPPLARVDAVIGEPIAASGDAPAFRIAESRGAAIARTYVAPDVAVCDECLAEVFDRADRRHRYPFTNCTNCGPRFTITRRLPYDRPHTTMAGFPLCAACAAEYHDPADRRFHAQPLACPRCGPRLWFEDADGPVEGTDAALAAAQRVLAAGGVVAVKGLGGYHLAVDATSDAALGRLRERKRRAAKPFAVMVRDLEAARRVAHLDDAEAACLAGPQRPIVLLRRRVAPRLSPLVAPGNPLVGLMLPYTPLHHLLFRPVVAGDAGRAPVPEWLVMTSGNLVDEPIASDDADARGRLGPLVDAWLLHDRPIHVPCDDSVLRVVDGAVLPIRRSRGFAPVPVRLPVASPPALAVGGELKNAFAIAAGHDSWLSQHIGDMGGLETRDAFERSVRQFREVYGITPELVVADGHPGYLTRRWAEEAAAADGCRLVLVQHHHAHVASVLAEHGVPAGEEVIGFAFDGTGYGADGTIWGGEVLVASARTCRRAAHLAPVPLPGGDATIRKPYRAALAHVWAAGIPWTDDLPPARAAGPDERVVLARQLERGVHCVPSSSMGRLFDAVSSLLGVRQVVSYEAQAAVELEALALRGLPDAAGYRFGRAGPDGAVAAGPVLAGVVADHRGGRPIAEIAAGFHAAVADLVVDAAEALRDRTGITRAALTGGVFQNVVLLRLARDGLRERGFEVLTHRLVPPNDGGLALGQVAVAAAREAP